MENKEQKEQKKVETQSLQQLEKQEISLNEQKIADEFGYSAAQVAVARRTVAQKTTLVELAYFLNVASSQGLNPFNKEVWCYKDHKNNLIIFAGRDGMLRKAQENPSFAGIRSCEVREKDDFEADVPNGIIHHKVKAISEEKRGKIIGAYCFVFRKDGEPTIEVVDLDSFDKAPYDKGYKSIPWWTHKADMIKKVAEHKALKKAFGFSSMQSEDDWVIKNGIAYPNGANKGKTVDADYEDLSKLAEGKKEE